MTAEVPGSLAAALVQLQARLPRIGKDAEADTGKYKYRYADLATITAAIFPLLAELGLYWVCAPGLDANGNFVLHYTLGHAPSGGLDMITGDYPLPNATPQTIGGAITYARRYALCAVTGVVADEDDDAAAAEAEARKPKSRSEERTAAGLMTSAQSRAHDRLVSEVKSQPKLADRARDTAGEVTDWTTGPPEESPGSITERQLRDLGIAFGKIGISDRQDRLTAVMSMLDLPEIESSKDLSYAQAEDLKRQLADLAAKEAGS